MGKQALPFLPARRLVARKQSNPTCNNSSRPAHRKLTLRLLGRQRRIKRALGRRALTAKLDVTMPLERYGLYTRTRC